MEPGIDDEAAAAAVEYTREGVEYFCRKGMPEREAVLFMLSNQLGLIRGGHQGAKLTEKQVRAAADILLPPLGLTFADLEKELTD